MARETAQAICRRKASGLLFQAADLMGFDETESAAILAIANRLKPAPINPRDSSLT